MKISHLLSALTLLGGVVSSNATLATWQAEVTGVGTAPAATLFTTVVGGSPIIFNVGTLTGDRAFEFVFNSSSGGISQAFMGTQDPAAGKQGLKYDQCCNTGTYGMTNFGVVDFFTSIPFDQNRDTHIVFTSNGVTTDMYVDGVNKATFATDLRMTGNQGLGAADNFGSFFDVMKGDILGFASYDAALSPSEIAAHAGAFVIPEPGTLALLLPVAGLMRRRR